MAWPTQSMSDLSHGKDSYRHVHVNTLRVRLSLRLRLYTGPSSLTASLTAWIFMHNLPQWLRHVTGDTSYNDSQETR